MGSSVTEAASLTTAKNTLTAYFDDCLKGAAAVELITRQQFGMMVALRENKITAIPLAEVLKGTRTLDLSLYHLAEIVE
jgi:hypothetical protein